MKNVSWYGPGYSFYFYTINLGVSAKHYFLVLQNHTFEHLLIPFILLLQ